MRDEAGLPGHKVVEGGPAGPGLALELEVVALRVALPIAKVGGARRAQEVGLAYDI